MATILMIREKIKSLYADYHRGIDAAMKAVLAFFMLSAINDKIGYMGRLDNMLMVLVLTVVCAAMPFVMTVIAGGAVVLAHMSALSMELALVAAVLFVIMVLLYLRFCGKDLILLILAPLSFCFGIPYVMPLVTGILFGPMSVLTLCCGITVHYYIDAVSVNALTIQGMSDVGTMEKFRMALDMLIKNEELFLALFSFAVTALLVHILRRQAIDHASGIAVLAGAMTNVVLNFMGMLVLDNGPGILQLLLGTIVSVPIAMLVSFLFRGLDYSRTERVQFEDEDYYYYVKAVPKMNIQAPAKTVKRINTQRYQTHQK